MSAFNTGIRKVVLLHHDTDNINIWNTLVLDFWIYISKLVWRPSIKNLTNLHPHTNPHTPTHTNQPTHTHTKHTHKAHKALSTHTLSTHILSTHTH